MMDTSTLLAGLAVLVVWGGGFYAGRLLRGMHLDRARHEGWMEGHSQGHDENMAALAARADVDTARHEGWMEGFNQAADIKLRYFDTEAER